ncbi:MAG: DUF2953 domain-containing protein [Clostridia bacterium]|nr:DUF2953 domain-containing protein [Clostridia bacterium]
MTGFQIFLLVLLGIVLFFVFVLSIPVRVILAYDDKIHVSVKYLFLKFDVLPLGPKKEKKPKAPKEPKPKEEKKPDATPKEKKPNPILEMIKANGHDGMIDVISNLGRVLGTYGGKLFKSVVFNRLELDISVGTGDSAATAVKYGQTCQKVFPVMGFICSNNLVRKYDINVEPDFLANRTEGKFYCDMSICIRKITNATLAMVVRLIFKVLIKFLTGAKKNNKENEETKTQTMKG